MGDRPLRTQQSSHTQRTRASQIQRTQESSQAEHSSQETRQIEEADVSNNENARKVLQFILNHSINKIPIKLADISKNCLNGSRIFPKILPIVKSHLENIYGITLIDVETHKSSGRRFMCINSLNKKCIQEYTEDDRKHLTLLFIILSCIYMKGGCMSEVGLFNFLRSLDIFENDDYFGNIKKIINDTLPKQLYLNKEKVSTDGSSDEQFIYSWGERADLEFSKKDMLPSVANIFNKPARCFMKQYTEVFGNEEQMDTEEMNNAE